MKALKRFMERIRPSFEAGGRLHAFRSVYEGMDTFLFTPRQTAAARGPQIHDAAALKILQKLAKQGRETAATYTANGRADLAEEELAQAAVIESYLPKQLSATEIEEIVKGITGLIKANMPSRIAFAVTSGVDRGLRAHK